MGPTWSTRWDRCSRASAKPHLGVTDCMNSVRSISAMSKQRVGQANSVGPIAHFGGIETLRRETESLQCHLGETKSHIGVTELTRVSGSGYVN